MSFSPRLGANAAPFAPFVLLLPLEIAIALLFDPLVPLLLRFEPLLLSPEPLLFRPEPLLLDPPELLLLDPVVGAVLLEVLEPVVVAALLLLLVGSLLLLVAALLLVGSLLYGRRTISSCWEGLILAGDPDADLPVTENNPGQPM
jgi:hypothetical protein